MARKPSQGPEMAVRLPESGCPGKLADLQSPLAVIVTHPWGPLGGSMDNNVVMGASFWFQKLKVTTLRFDFGGSQFGRGYTQVDQVREAARALLSGELQRQLPLDPDNQTTEEAILPSRILLVGYSYGSIISASAAAAIPQVIGVVCIAPPLGVRHWLHLFHGNYHLEQMKKRTDIPKLLVLGDSDNFTSEKSFLAVVQTMPQESSTGALLKDADHFFRGREKDLMDIVGHWLLNVFPQCKGNLTQLAIVDFPLYDAPSVSSGSQILGAGCHVCVGLEEAED